MPIYRFKGDILFSPTLREDGVLHFDVPKEALKNCGIPLGKDVCINVAFAQATVEAPYRNAAYDTLRSVVTNLQCENLPHLRACNEISYDWSRADVLWLQERQLLQFTQAEQDNPDTIMENVDETNLTAWRRALRRRTKLRRILGMRSFVLAHPNLDIRCRDERSPAARLIIGCNEDHQNGSTVHGVSGGVAATYLTTTGRIHLKDLSEAEGAETFIEPTDVEAFNTFMAHVAAVAAASWHPPAPVIHAVIDAESIPF